MLSELQAWMQSSENVIDDYHKEQCYHNNRWQLQEADSDIPKNKLSIWDNEAEAGNADQTNQH
jgi:hypothetical protein